MKDNYFLRDCLDKIESGLRPAGGVDFESGDIPSLGGENIIQKGGISYFPVKKISISFYNKLIRGIAIDCDVLINKDGANTGKVGFYNNKYYKKAAINEHLFLLRGKKEILDQKYLYFVLLSEKGQSQIKRQITGSAQPGLNSSFINYFKLNIPFLPQQRKIAQILSICDTVIDKTEAAINKYQDIKKGLMHDLFTRGIDLKTGKLRPKYEDAPEIYKESELGMIPIEWEIKEFQEFFKFISYGFTNPMPELDEGPFMVTAANVINGSINYPKTRKTSQKLFDTILTEKSKPKIGDLLLTKDGTLGRLAIVDKSNVCINQSVAVIRFNDDINPLFFKIMLETPIYQKKMLDDAGGSTIKHIYITIIDKMLLALPTTKAERNIISERIELINMKLQIENDTLSKYQKLKDGLMQDLLTGKVEVENNTN